MPLYPTLPHLPPLILPPSPVTGVVIVALTLPRLPLIYVNCLRIRLANIQPAIKEAGAGVGWWDQLHPREWATECGSFSSCVGIRCQFSTRQRNAQEIAEICLNAKSNDRHSKNNNGIFQEKLSNNLEKAIPIKIGKNRFNFTETRTVFHFL